MTAPFEWDISGFFPRGSSAAPPSFWTLKDARLARYIRQREMKQAADRYGGITYTVLMRIHNGTLCPACSNANTGESENSRCPTCFGVGLIDGGSGGYYSPIACRGRHLSLETDIEQGETGTDAKVVQAIRHMPYPILYANDLVVLGSVNNPALEDIEGTTPPGVRDMRFWVAKAPNAAEIKGVSFIQHLQLMVVEPGDIVYTISVGGAQ